MTNEDFDNALVPLGEDAIARIDAAATGFPDTGEDPFADPADQAGARAAITAHWPEFPDFAAGVGEKLWREPYYVVVRGVPLSAPDVFFAALTSSLGDPVDPYAQDWSRLIYRIRPGNDRSVGGKGVLNEHLHTDGTDWPDPNSLTCLLCERPDQNGGGRSRLLGHHRLVQHLRATDESLLDLLSTPVPWGLNDVLGGGVVTEPVLTADRVRWLRHTIDAAVAGGAEIDERLAGALGRVEELIDGCPLATDVLLRSGDLLLLNNARCMHARTPVTAPAESERVLSRIKVMVPGRRAVIR